MIDEKPDMEEIVEAVAEVWCDTRRNCNEDPDVGKLLVRVCGGGVR